MKNIYDNLLLHICNISIKAGHEIMQFYNNNNEVIFKKDSSPLTEADLAANNLIIQELNSLDKKIKIITEESLVDWNTRKTWSQYWLVDPLDGTKEFINKNDEFTVNIALIEKNEPVIGIIYAPALSKLYYASKNNGAFKLTGSKIFENLNESQSIKVNRLTNLNETRIISSRSHSNDKVNNWISENFDKVKFLKKGSSLKFCEIAEGNADFYPRFGPTSEWDIAAGHIILKEAGGTLLTLNNKQIFYNTKDSLINPEFVASNNLIKI